jgi:hypothetical protein
VRVGADKDAGSNPRMRYLSATHSVLLVSVKTDCDGLAAVLDVILAGGADFSLHCLSLSIYTPLLDAFTCPRPPLEVQLFHLHRRSLDWLEAIALGFPISSLRIVQLPIRASPCNICNRVPVPFTVLIPDTGWGHVPTGDGLEHSSAAVKVMHAFSIPACQAVKGAHHGKGDTIEERGSKSGTGCESAAEGVTAEFELPGQVAVPEDIV